jgi:murein tripeptide amidase MpaA
MNTPSPAALLLSLLVANGCIAAHAAAPRPETSSADLRTLAEITGYAQTGRMPEVERLCHAYARHWPKQVRCIEFGRSPEGRPMLALVASDGGALSPAEARQRRRPVLLFQGGIHAGEIDGKDAGFKALRDLLEGRVARGALGKITVVFVPVYNVDGHERFAAWNRPNQRGPEEMGWRTTAQNLNLNRDYVKAEAPETRAMLGLLNDWDPILYVDLHVTDGAQFEEEISVQVEPAEGWDPILARTGRELRDTVVDMLRKQGFRALNFYPSFEREDDPTSGFAVSVSKPRFSTSYGATRNRYASLVETHSWKPYPQRVASTQATIVAMIELAARDGARWLAAGRDADARMVGIGGQPVALSFRTTDAARMIDFRGYAYSREPSDVSGQRWTRYDESRPQVWQVPLKYEVVPDLVVNAPLQGYVVPAAYAAMVADKLGAHGIRFETLTAPQARAALQAFRAEQVEFSPRSDEGKVSVRLSGAWQNEQRDIPAGSLFVPVAQPKARLVMSLLEPQAPDSLATWGFFNSAFERKEYMEDYLLEAWARELLQRDPAVRSEFEQRLRSDPKFAADPAARLQFFYRRHPSWDERYNLYPIYRR